MALGLVLQVMTVRNWGLGCGRVDASVALTLLTGFTWPRVICWVEMRVTCFNPADRCHLACGDLLGCKAGGRGYPWGRVYPQVNSTLVHVLPLPVLKCSCVVRAGGVSRAISTELEGNLSPHGLVVCLVGAGWGVVPDRGTISYWWPSLACYRLQVTSG